MNLFEIIKSQTSDERQTSHVGSVFGDRKCSWLTTTYGMVSSHREHMPAVHQKSTQAKSTMLKRPTHASYSPFERQQSGLPELHGELDQSFVEMGMADVWLSGVHEYSHLLELTGRGAPIRALEQAPPIHTRQWQTWSHVNLKFLATIRHLTVEPEAVSDIPPPSGRNLTSTIGCATSISYLFFVDVFRLYITGTVCKFSTSQIGHWVVSAARWHRSRSVPDSHCATFSPLSDSFTFFPFHLLPSPLHFPESPLLNGL